MKTESAIPRAAIDGCSAAHERLHTLIREVSDRVARRPCALQGWTVGHLLTHIARNADSHRGMFEAAARGERAAQYPGGSRQRAGDIDAGAGRSAGQLVRDVLEADRRLEESWAAVDDSVWITGLGTRSHGPTALPDLIHLRWREVEVHLPDLQLTELGGPDWSGLSPAYVDAEWPRMLAGLEARLPEDLAVLLIPRDRPSRAAGESEDVLVIDAPPHRILEWLFGRGGADGWPTLGLWS